jgi:hypothetical protein
MAPPEERHPGRVTTTVQEQVTPDRRHPGAVLWRNLTQTQRGQIAEAWKKHNSADPAVLFDGLGDEGRWETICLLEGRDGSYANEAERIADNADPETMAKFDEMTAPDGTAILDELFQVVTKYVVLPSAEAMDSVVLWIAATHGLPAFEHATRLAIHSPVKRCGKSRLLEIIDATAHSPIPTTNISVPALFRMIDAASHPPTLILDEVDRLLGTAKKDEDNRDLVAILNNGFRPGRPTFRCVGPTQVPTPFSNFAMVALAGIGRMTDTIEDRAVNITMRRRLPGETIAKYRLRTDAPALHDLRDRLAEWVGSVMTKLELPVADIPDELEDRAEDAWEPLIAVADAAGGHWPARARAAAVKLTREAATDDDDSLDTRILADVRLNFIQAQVTFLPTAELLMELRKLDEAPWRDLDLTKRKLAYRLGKFGVKPKHNTARTARGYHLHDLQDAFHRYLPAGDASNASIRPESPSDLQEPRGRIETDGRIDASARNDASSSNSLVRPQNGRIRTDWTDVPDNEGEEQ